MIRKINIIGSGNVATILGQALSSKVEVCTVYSKQIENALNLAEKIKSVGVDRLDKLSLNVDLNIILLKDDVIAEVAQQLPKNIPIVHTSGSIPIDVFDQFKNYGILYPLQTFSKDSNLNIEEVPFLIEGDSSYSEDMIMNFCKENLSKNI